MYSPYAHNLANNMVCSINIDFKAINFSCILFKNGARRRTPGGVFFHLIKTSDDLPREKINEVFSEDKRAYAKNRKKTANEIKKMRAAKFKEALTKGELLWLKLSVFNF